MLFTKKLYGNQFSSRDERNKFISSELSEYIGESVLNIGGGGKHYMKKYLPSNTNYFELDIAGTPDLKINLEKELPIPTQDESYNTVICTDVLEHLDNFHEVFEELLRVSKDYVIISLPNSVNDSTNYFRNIFYTTDNEKRKNQFGKYIKFYGLPYEKPEDRHKWFFSYTEAEDFFIYNAKKLNFDIKEIFPLGYYENKQSFKSFLLRMFLSIFGSEDLKKNILSKSIWVVIEKKK